MNDRLRKTIAKVLPGMDFRKFLKRTARRFNLPAATAPFIDSFHYRSDDVVIVSYPKSGSTWLRFIAAHLINDRMPGDLKEIDFLRVQRIVPAISREALEKGGADYEALPAPRILRSHSMYNSKFPKVIYMLRDGRDVLISFYYHFLRQNRFSGTLYEFLCSNCRETEWDDHINSWIYQNPSLSNICVIKYEDMLDNPVQEVRKMMDFAGLERTDEQIRSAVEASTFQKLAQIEKQRGLGYNDPGNTSIRFVRKGRGQQWKEEFGEREKALFKSRYGNALIKAGYESSSLW